MRFEQLHYLEATLREGSLRSAAAKLGISQPSLSAQIQRLEEDLGIVLLVRTPHGVLATDAAEAVLPYVRAAMRAQAALLQEASAITGLRAGQVRLGTISAASNSVLPSVVRQFQREYPNINFQVIEEGSTHIREMVIAGDFDVGIISRYGEDPEDDRLRYVDLAQGRIALAVHRDHPLASRESVCGRDLNYESFVAFHEGYLLRDALELLAQAVDIHVVYYTDNAETAQRMVTAGVGLALASTLATHLRPQQRVTHVRINEPWAETRMSVVLRSDEQPPPAVRTFLRMLRSEASRQRGGE